MPTPPLPRAMHLIECYIPSVYVGTDAVQHIKDVLEIYGGGTTTYNVVGTYHGEAPEDVSILTCYVSARYPRHELLATLQELKASLLRSFPQEREILIVLHPATSLFI